MDLSNKVKVKEIDGKQITVTPFFGLTSLTHKTRIIKLLGPGVNGLFKIDIKSLKNIKEADIGFIGFAISQLCEKLNPDEFASFILDLLSSTRIDGVEIKKAVFDTEFMGNLTFMYKILWFVLEVNWGDFFEGGVSGWIKKKVKERIEEEKKNIQTPAESKQ